MKSFRKTVWMLIGYRPSIVALIVLNAFASQAIVYSMINDRLSYSNLNSSSIKLSVVFLLAVGLYVGFALSSFRNSYIWQLNQRYRYTLTKAYLVALVIFTLAITPLTFVLLFDNKILMLAPFVVAGSGMLHRVIIPLSTLGLFVFMKLNNSFLIWIMMLAAIESVLHLLKKATRSSHPISSLYYWGSWTGVSDLLAEQLSAYRYLNAHFGGFLSKRLSKQRKHLDWAVLSISSKFGLPSIIWSIFFVVFFRAVGDHGGERFAALFAINFMLTITAEARQNVAQTRHIAHLFSTRNRSVLRTKVLLAVDKSTFTNLLAMIGLMLIALVFYENSTDSSQIIFPIMQVGLILIAFNPILMSVNSRVRSIKMIIPVMACLAAVYVTLFHLSSDLAIDNILSIFLHPEFYIFVASIVLIRYFGTRYFYNRSLEQIFGRS